MKKGYTLVQVIIIIFVTSVISALTVGIILYNNSNIRGKSYSSLILDEDFEDFLDVYYEINSEFYEDVDKKKLIKGAIDGMMEYLNENYSTYMDQEEANSLIGSLNEKYNGIGIVILGNVVTNVISGSPAESAGIMIGDKILSVNNVDVTTDNGSKITELVKEYEEVSLVVDRNGVEKKFVVSIDELNVPKVNFKKLDNSNIGYINIELFSSNIVSEVKNALVNLKNENINSLIIDLRGNSGGYLDKAYDTASLFINKGKIIYYLDSKNSNKKAFKDNDDNNTDYNIVVLINGSTASAAEILASALKDSYGAIIVGTKSFGKGKVQHTYNLSDGDLIKYTTSKWYRPNGECIDTIGITPDYVVEIEFITEKDEDGNDIPVDYIDTQLNKAIELLSK